MDDWNLEYVVTIALNRKVFREFNVLNRIEGSTIHFVLKDPHLMHKAML